MLVLRNGSNVMAEGGKPLGNNELNALRIENTDRITIGFVTTGPIAISWGDGTTLNLVTQAARYNASKLYGSVGNWNIIITNPKNVKALYIQYDAGYGNTTKINTSVSWFYQYYNLEYLVLKLASFNGDIAPVLNKLPKIKHIIIAKNTLNPNLYFNISKCPTIWSNLTWFQVSETESSCNLFQGGSYSDIDLRNNNFITYFGIQTFSNNRGDFTNILKCPSQVLYFLCLRSYDNTQVATHAGLQSIDDIIVNPSLKSFTLELLVTPFAQLVNFNFLNINYFFCKVNTTIVDVSGNASFAAMAAGSDTSEITICSYQGSVKLNLNDIKGAGIVKLWIDSAASYVSGDITMLASRSNISSIYLLGNTAPELITGSVTSTYAGMFLQFSNANVNISANDLKVLFTKTHLTLNKLPNLTGDLSGCNFSLNLNTWGIYINNMANLYADITTFTFNSTFWNSSYSQISMAKNPHFTGNLANLTLWANKPTVDLSVCAYTNIPGFIRKIFTNRNTCLKAGGGMTAIYVQGNVDNGSLTGMYQQPNLGTYTGNRNDLTEAQIDNLANGLDYTGTGTNTAWTDKEKIWFMVNCKNSSTDTSLRYRVTINY